MNSAGILTRLQEFRVIPVVVLSDASDAEPLAQALMAGGLPCAEVTFRTDAAAEAIRIMAETADIVLGAGTVLSPRQVEVAIGAGAQFIVTPGFSQSVVDTCLDESVPVFPGVATPTEVQTAIEAGLDTVKYFPAEALGGVQTLKAISAPFGHVRFIPTGGINAENAGAYLAMSSVVAVGGSWLVKPTLIGDGQFETIARLAKEVAKFRSFDLEGASN